MDVLPFPSCCLSLSVVKLNFGWLVFSSTSGQIRFCLERTERRAFFSSFGDILRDSHSDVWSPNNNPLDPHKISSLHYFTGLYFGPLSYTTNDKVHSSSFTLQLHFYLHSLCVHRDTTEISDRETTLLCVCCSVIMSLILTTGKHTMKGFKALEWTIINLLCNKPHRIKNIIWTNQPLCTRDRAHRLSPFSFVYSLLPSLGLSFDCSFLIQTLLLYVGYFSEIEMIVIEVLWVLLYQRDD